MHGCQALLIIQLTTNIVNTAIISLVFDDEVAIFQQDAMEG